MANDDKRSGTALKSACPRYPKIEGCKCRHCVGKCLCHRNVPAWPCPNGGK